VSTTQSPTNQEDRTAAAGPSADRERQGPSSGERRGPTPPTPRDSQPTGAPASEEPSTQSTDEPASDRAVDADVLLDIPRLAVDELNLELEAAFVLQRVKLDAKGLDAGLFFKSNLDNIAALTSGRSSDDDDAGPAGEGGGGGAARVRSGLRELLGSTRDTYRDVQHQLGAVYESAGEAYERVVGGDADDDGEGGGQDAGEGDGGGDGATARAAKRGAKAVGLTAAGLAGGALLESTLKPSHRLPLPRRRNRAQALVHEIQRRLP
jgi:hypothetical protein